MAFIDSSRSLFPAPATAPETDAPPAPPQEPEEAEPEQEFSGDVVPEDDYETPAARLRGWCTDPNVARHFDGATLSALGNEVSAGYQIDEISRAEWLDEAQHALDFATQKAQPKQYPWPNASNIIFPLITQAAFAFSAMTYPAIIENRSLVRGQVWGSDDGTPATVTGRPGGPPKMDADGNIVWLIPPGDKERRASLIGQHMSWQVLEEMPEWESQTDTLLMQLPIVGGAVRKTFRDTVEDANVSVLVSLLDIVWNKNAPSFDRAPRHTEIVRKYPHEIDELEADGTFLRVPYGGADIEQGVDPNDPDAPRLFLEQHCRYDLDGDGYPEPLIVTVTKSTGRVVRIAARFDPSGIHEDSEGRIRRIVAEDDYTLYSFLPDPRGGSYPVGFGHLVKPLNEAINTSLNQMFDAAHLQIAGGGFVGTSLSIASGPVNFQLGEYKPVNNRGQSIRDAVFPIPFPGPSQVLFQLLGFLVNAAKDVTSIQNVLSGDASLANMQPTTLLALIEQGMRLYTAIYKRVYRSLKSEFNKLYRLNRIYLQHDERFKIADVWLQVTPEDYRLGGGVVPIADPNMVTDMQKVSRAMVLMTLKDDPYCDPVAIRREFFASARIEQPEKFLKPPQGPPPQAMLQMQEAQANLGRARAAELKDSTQAYLNLALAQKAVGEAEVEKIGPYLDAIRFHIESINSTIKAADVDAKMHGHDVRMKAAGKEAQIAGNNARAAAQQVSPGKPAAAGPGPGVLPPVAPQPGDQGVPPVSGGPGGQLPAGAPGPMGGG